MYNNQWEKHDWVNKGAFCEQRGESCTVCLSLFRFPCFSTIIKNLPQNLKYLLAGKRRRRYFNVCVVYVLASCVCVLTCMCMCVCERERESECVVFQCVCVCVCVCVLCSCVCVLCVCVCVCVCVVFVCGCVVCAYDVACVQKELKFIHTCGDQIIKYVKPSFMKAINLD